jgi:hypothetical protein
VRPPRALLGALLLGALGCDGRDRAPGTLTATLVSPHGEEGAAHLTLFGPGLIGASALDARTYSHQRGDTLEVVVVREQPGTLRFVVSVADTTRRPGVAVNEVAGGDDRLRADPHRYHVELRP